MQQREIRVFDDTAEGWERLVRRDSRYVTSETRPPAKEWPLPPHW